MVFSIEAPKIMTPDNFHDIRPRLSTGAAEPHA
jgi:hypothetical protein